MKMVLASYALSALSGMFFISGLAVLIGGKGGNYVRSGESGSDD